VGIVVAHPRDNRQARDWNDPRGRSQVPIDRVTLRRRRETYTRGGGTRRILDEPLAVSLWELRVVFTVGKSVIYSRGRNKSETEGREEKRKKNRRIVCDLTHFTQPDTISVRCRALYKRVVMKRACFGAEAAIASAGSRRVGTLSWKIVPTSGHRTEWSSG